MSFCSASVELRCTGTGVDSGGGFCGHLATYYFYWWLNCAGWRETAVIDSDKHYVPSPKERLTGLLLVVRRYRMSRHEEWSCCYLINIPYCIYITLVFRLRAVWLYHSAVLWEGLK